MKRAAPPSRGRVTDEIASSLRDGRASLRSTALGLGISTRSLQRRLAAMATSYSALETEVRIDEACRSLATSDEKIADLSARLGYAGPSSFSRAFMRLKQVQPRAYRQIHQRKHEKSRHCS